MHQFYKENEDRLMNFTEKNTKYSILYLAVRAGHYLMVEYILARGINLDFSKDKSTPMHCAAYYGHYEIIPLLLTYGIPFNIKNYSNFLPIEEAATQ
jgi:ankyrin repeat protein